MDRPGSSQPTRPGLFIRIRDLRDGEAWEVFVDMYLPMIYRYARRMGLQDADAADASQEVLTEVARCIRAFEYHPDRGRFRDWLGVLVRRRVFRFLKKKDRETADPSEEESNALEQNPADVEWNDEFNPRILVAAMEKARPHFEPRTWQAFEGVWLENRRAVDVAADLNLPIEMIYTSKSLETARVGLEKIARSTEAAGDLDRGAVVAYEQLGGLLFELGRTPEAIRA